MTASATADGATPRRVWFESQSYFAALKAIGKFAGKMISTAPRDQKRLRYFGSRGSLVRVQSPRPSSQIHERVLAAQGLLLDKKTTTYLWSPYCLAQRRLAQRLRGLELSDHIGADSTCGRSADLDRYLPGNCRTRTVRFGGGTTGLGCRERGLTTAGGDERPAHAPVAVRRRRELLDDVGVR